MSKTTSTDLIDRIIARETNPADPTSIVHDPHDQGGRTQYGISEQAHPEAWADGQVTQDEARQIYQAIYVRPFELLKDHLAYEQLVDWGVTSGPTLVIMRLQALVGTEPDGRLGPKTLAAIRAKDPLKLNNQIVASRIKMISRLVQKRPSQLRFLGGWLDRALGFLRP